MGKNKIGRNDPCHCGSGLKLKRCHGDFVKIEVAGRAYQAKFNELIEAEKAKAEEITGAEATPEQVFKTE